MALLVVWLAAACAIEDGIASPEVTATPTAQTSSLPVTAPPVTPPTPGQRTDVPGELLGDWLQRTDSELPGAYQQRVFRFHPDGRYEYWNEWCPAYNECSGGYEWGFVEFAAGVLTLVPQTASVEGQRTYPYSVGIDAIGAPVLQFVRPSDVDIFYRP